MKKILLIGSLFMLNYSFGQIFSDNFDSYTAGSYLGPQSAGAWTTWSNAPGTAEDVKVSSANSVSGANSLYFSSNVNGGGPVDLVRNFGIINTGQFDLEFNMLVESGKAGYFNLQRNATIGQVWSMDANFNDDGTLTIINQSGLSFTTTYTQGSWFNFRLEIDFNINRWEVFIDNVSKGYFNNTENQIASIDIFPVDQNAPYSAGYFIDDFITTRTAFVLPTKNAAVNFVGFNGGNLAGNAVGVDYQIRNLGTQTITSFDVATTYNGVTVNQNYTSLNLVSMGVLSYSIPSTITLVPGTNDITVTVSNVNGSADDNALDNTGSAQVSPIVPAMGKMVVGEEATGTWCQWCPRGAVNMDLMENKYGNFWAGVAVHNNDPMTLTAYDAGIGGYISGYPSSIVDRGSAIDPSGMEPIFLNRVTLAPKAFITNGAIYDAVTRELKVSVTYNFQSAATSAYKYAVVLTEDDVTGTSGYAQANAYAGGASGVMGGFESLPNPVPAAQMVYDHVGREIAPAFGGGIGFPATVNAGYIQTQIFTFTLPATWDETKMHIIGMLIAPNGTVDNAGKATIAEAEANGYVDGLAGVSSQQLSGVDDALQIYPNPATSFSNIVVTTTNNESYSIEIRDMSGKLLTSKNYVSNSKIETITINTELFNAGVYFVSLVKESGTMVKKLIIE